MKVHDDIADLMVIPNSMCLYHVLDTKALQPVATCRQSPYLHKPAIIIMTSFATELATPSVTDERTDTLPRLIYED